MQLRPCPQGRFTANWQQHYPEIVELFERCTMNTQHLDAGDLIMCQGQPLTYLYEIPKGRIAISLMASNGKRFQLGAMDCDHQIFGEMEFFTDNLCQCDIQAEQALAVRVICCHMLQSELLQRPELALFFATAIAHDYQDTIELYTRRVLHSISHNIAHDLLLESLQQMPVLSFNKVGYEAERFGTSDRVYRRAVNSLIEQRLVIRRDGKLEICDLERLKAFVRN